MMNGKVIVPRGAAVTLQVAKVEQAGKMKGADKITLKANSICVWRAEIRHRHELRRVEGLG
jgi:hypothetical protein